MKNVFNIELYRFSAQVSLEELNASLNALLLDDLQIEENEALWQVFDASIEQCENCLVSLPICSEPKRILHFLSRPNLFLQQLYSLIKTIHFRSDYEISMFNSHTEFSSIFS